MMDIIRMLHSGEISLEEAQRIFDETIARVHRKQSPPQWWETLELSEFEATALAHGANLPDLVKLRYEGWPATCCRCGQRLDYKQYGWVFEQPTAGEPALRHIECPEGG